MKKNKLRITIKKALLMLCSISLLCHFYNKSKLVNSPPHINSNYDETNYFATYSNGKIYICTTSNQNEICSKATSSDIVIVDKRDEVDPDVKVLKSYSIYDIFTMREVLNVIMEYEKINPSDWDRTYESMQTEWICHNLSYLCDFETGRTADADFNNQDEEIYQNFTLEKALQYKDTFNE